jgi:hypothetical protein
MRLKLAEIIAGFNYKNKQKKRLVFHPKKLVFHPKKLVFRPKKLVFRPPDPAE